MRKPTTMLRVILSAAAVTIVLAVAYQLAYACRGTRTAVPPAVFPKTLVMGKAPIIFLLPPIIGAPLPIGSLVTVPVTVFCASGPAVGGGGGTPPTPTSASSTLRMAFDALPPAGPVCACLEGCGSVATAGAAVVAPCGAPAPPVGAMVPPITCAPAPMGAFTTFPVTITTIVPAPLGAHCIFGSTSVTFSDGMTLTALGDTIVCVVEESSDIPGVPRLGVSLMNPDFQFVAPGDQVDTQYRITNNDLSESVTLTVTGTSTQVAITPASDPPPGPGQTPESMGVYAVADLVGDDFVIAFVDDPDPDDCIPLPDHPHIQDPVTMPLILAPGASQVITLAVRPWGQCATGSCIESTLILEGTYSNGDPALACSGTSVFVDTSLPNQNWGGLVNDCQPNGVADADDLIMEESVDTNGNGIPDECDLEPPSPAGPPHNLLKNRYISIDPRGASGNNRPDHHIRVSAVSSEVNGQDGNGPWWAAQPDAACISVVTTTKPEVEPDWTGCNTLHLTGCPIIPTTTYAITAEAGGVVSADGLFDTQAKPGIKWHGDCVGFFTGTEWTGPNGQTSIDDAVAAIKTFQNPDRLPGCGTPPCNATHTSVTDVVPNLIPGPQINKIVNIADVFSIIQGFQGHEYPGPDLTQCP